MAGNRLGPREKYVYIADDGTEYALETDQSLAIAGTGSGAAAPVVYDPETSDAGPPPKRFKPRVVFVQAADGARKELICFSPTASLYQTSSAETVTIDAEAGWDSTGRRGEKLTF